MPPWAESLADVDVACRQDGLLEHRLEALARGMDVARGEIILAVDTARTHVTSDLAERLLTLYFGPGRNAVRASQHVTLPRTTGAADRPMRTPVCCVPRRPRSSHRRRVDLHPAFAGDRATPLELAWRLQRFGVPVLLDDGDEAVLHAVAPWWTRPPFSGEMLHSVSSLLWPGLFDEDCIEPLLSWRQVTTGRTARDLLYVEATESGFNVFRLDGQFVAIRRSLGALHFRLGAARLVRKYGEAHVVVGDALDDVRQRATVLAGHEGPKATGRPDGPPPAAVLVDYGRLFAVMKVRGKLVAVRHTLGPLNFEMIEDLEALAAAYGPRNVIVDDTPERLRDRIRAVVTPPAPAT